MLGVDQTYAGHYLCKWGGCGGLWGEASYWARSRSISTSLYFSEVFPLINVRSYTSSTVSLGVNVIVIALLNHLVITPLQCDSMCESPNITNVRFTFQGHFEEYHKIRIGKICPSLIQTRNSNCSCSCPSKVH